MRELLSDLYWLFCWALPRAFLCLLCFRSFVWWLS